MPRIDADVVGLFPSDNVNFLVLFKESKKSIQMLESARV